MKHLGHSPSEEITRVRLERAKELLRTTDLAIEEVARLAGFIAIETMYRVFKVRVKQTPAQYRAARRQSYLKFGRTHVVAGPSSKQGLGANNFPIS